MPNDTQQDDTPRTAFFKGFIVGAAYMAAMGMLYAFWRLG